MMNDTRYGSDVDFADGVLNVDMTAFSDDDDGGSDNVGGGDGDGGDGGGDDVFWNFDEGNPHGSGGNSTDNADAGTTPPSSMVVGNADSTGGCCLPFFKAETPGKDCNDYRIKQQGRLLDHHYQYDGVGGLNLSSSPTSCCGGDASSAGSGDELFSKPTATKARE